jgi:Fe-S-cluster containining protein
MKTLTGKVRAVNRVFMRLEREINRVQEESGLRCLSGCGECCKKPDIEATALEFLPLALEWYDRGIAMERYEALKDKEESICHVFTPHVNHFGGLCNEYPNRGLICRLFGYSARIDKEGKKELVTCKLLKEQRTQEVAEVVKRISEGRRLPVMSEYCTRLNSIDPELSRPYPINEAMKKAVEIVLQYYAYRRRRKSGHKKS